MSKLPDDLFPNMIFEENEYHTFLKYIKLKGIFLHKQVYDIILLTDEKATYSEISTIIRYDKYLRDVLYKYLSALEEQWRSLLFEYFEYDSSKDEILTGDIKIDKVIPKIDYSSSNFYWATYNKNFTLNKLITIMKPKIELLGLNVYDDEFDTIKDLRNKVMHHNLIMFSHHTSVGAVDTEIKILEYKIMVLWKLLDSNIRNAIEVAINKGNYKGGNYQKEKANLNRYCLRRFENGVFI